MQLDLFAFSTRFVFIDRVFLYQLLEVLDV
jgi:hypothetical protein